MSTEGWITFSYVFSTELGLVRPVSSTAERVAVNHQAVGSNPIQGFLQF